jgi:hypothetical protein
VVDNLITNGSFEDGYEEWDGPEASLATRSFFPVHGGFHLTLRQSNTQAAQKVTGLTPGATYVLSGFIRNNPSSVPEEIRLGVRYNEDEDTLPCKRRNTELAKRTICH